MPRIPLSLLVSFNLLLATSALAQTTAPAPDAAAGRGVADWWWIILIVVLVAVAIWYFTRGRRGTPV